MKKPLHERIAATEKRKAELAARLTALKGRAKAVDRKRDARRKIVVGAAVLVEIERTPQFAKFVRTMLDKAVTRPQDREVIADLLQAATETVTPAVNANSAPSIEPGELRSSGQVTGVFGTTTHEKLSG